MSHLKSTCGPALVRAAVATALGTAVLFGTALPAAAAEEDVVELEEVQVTGTRITQNADYVSPNPVTTFDAADLERLGINNISDAITQVPQNTSQFSPANTGGSAFYVGSTLANLRGLNPFFGTRTLTLVDTRRFIPTTQGDAVDLNFIPSNLVQRVETVTGGASAAYGSGAISGVVNIILDKRLRGVKLDADYGLTQEGDGDNYRIGLAGGSDFADGRGHFVIGGEFQEMDPIQSCPEARGWCAEGRGLFFNSTLAATANGEAFTPRIAGLPYFAILDGLRQNQLSRSGVIYSTTPGDTSTWQFNAAGTDILPFSIGTAGTSLPVAGQSTLVQGGDGDPVYTNLTLQPDVSRKTLFSHGEFEFTDKLTGYVELSYGQVKGRNNQFESGQNSAPVCIMPDNAFLTTLSPAAQDAIADNIDNAAAMPGLNLPCNGGTVIQKNWQGQNLQVVTTDTKVTRGVLGLTTKVGDNWSWDTYYQYGRTIRDQIGSGYRTSWRYTLATDAILDGGVPVCRSDIAGQPAGTLFDPILLDGCQPLNPFGMSAASDAALAYAFGSLTEHNKIRQDVVATSISGRLFDGWAGPVSAAFGVEWRKDKLSNDAGDLPLALRTDFGLQYGDSFAGSTKVLEGFAEFEVPLLADMPLAQRLSLNAAVRQAQYETSGATGGAVGSSNKQNITTWKLASVWDPSDWLRFRGSYSRDVRAANFRELFYSQTIPAGSTFGQTANPAIDAGLDPDGSQNDAFDWNLLGNTDVTPEKSKTLTAGIVLQPSGALDGLQFSTDYYQIKLDDGLRLVAGGFGALFGCVLGFDPSGCDYVEFGPVRPGQESNPNAAVTNIERLLSTYANDLPYTAKGLDFAVNYQLPGQLGALPGRFAISAAATHMIEQTAPQLNAAFITNLTDVVGQTGGDSGFLSDVAPAPSWTGNVALTYFNGSFTGTVQTRFVGKGHLDLQNPKVGPDDPSFDPAVSGSINDNTTGTYFVTNANVAWDLETSSVERLQLFGTINNLFDRDPPYSMGVALGGVGGVNAINYDTLGRTFRIGVRMKF